MGKIFCADNYLYKQISSKTKQAPKALQDKEFSKAAKELQNDLSIHEKGKNDGTFIFNNPLSVNTRGGDSLYSILYKNMKYKIMEVRDGKEPWADASRKEAFLELTYDSPGRAPTNLGKKKIKKAVVKIIFAEWKSGNKVNYKVTHYEPTEYGLT
jgi:hypothetical protein